MHENNWELFYAILMWMYIYGWLIYGTHARDSIYDNVSDTAKIKSNIFIEKKPFCNNKNKLLKMNRISQIMQSFLGELKY